MKALGGGFEINNIPSAAISCAGLGNNLKRALFLPASGAPETPAIRPCFPPETSSRKRGCPLLDAPGRHRQRKTRVLNRCGQTSKRSSSANPQALRASELITLTDNLSSADPAIWRPFPRNVSVRLGPTAPTGCFPQKQKHRARQTRAELQGVRTSGIAGRRSQPGMHDRKHPSIHLPRKGLGWQLRKG